MKLITQFTKVLLLYAACEVFVRLTHLPLPGALLGMLVFAALLCGGVVKVGQVEDACDFCLQNMVLFFIPPAVGLLSGYQHLRGNLLPFLFIMVVTTVLVFGVSALVTSALMRRQNAAATTTDAKAQPPQS